MTDALLIARYAVFTLFVVAVAAATASWLVRTRRVAPFTGTGRALKGFSDRLIKPVEARLFRAGGNPVHAGWWLVIGVAVLGIVGISLLEWLWGVAASVQGSTGGGPRSVIAVDTNLLVYAHREDSDWHDEARNLLAELAVGIRRWAIPWPCVHEFLSITTHPSIYLPPTPMAQALEAMRVWLSSPFCRTIGEGPDYLAVLQDVALKGKAICLQNGVTELWSADRDLSRFRALRVLNPLIRRT